MKLTSSTIKLLAEHSSLQTATCLDETSTHGQLVNSRSSVVQPKSTIRLSWPLSEAVQEQNGDMWNGKTDNKRFILFSVSMTSREPAALPSLLCPQFSHRSPIVLPFQKEN